ncbi:DUF4956 domain-containing protein [Butyrivibrio proteoclasticus]|uniref:DUF4956 domain-containing protein n=1 Tax=Butyrivibrio proteoclasticus TaxID=43305 RepID=UPI00047C341E|nr:DUF4956 domain-containing protein [Butyrivibrio proteoclasticus]
MKFSDVFKKSFLEGYSTVELSTEQILVVMLITTILALYIFFCYRLLTRRTFYSKNFNLSLVAMALITAGIILTIQSSVVVSLGMVGALSIVRFRTAVKDPMDLIFMFWAIGVGIMCGAGLSEIAILTSLIVTLLIFLLDKMPVAKAPMILVIGADDKDETATAIENRIKELTSSYKLKSQSISNGTQDLVYELRIKEAKELVAKISKIDGVTSASILSHDGEVTF